MDIKWKHTPKAVQELFEQYSANEIIEFLEQLDLYLVSEGVRQGFSEAFEIRYEFTIYLLKRAVRALEPPKIPKQSDN